MPYKKFEGGNFMKKLLSIILAIVFVVSMLSGCGVRNQSASTSESKSTSESAPASTGTSKEEPAKEASLKSFGHMTDPVKINAYNNIISAFKKDNPTINVEPEDMDYNNFLTTLKTRAAAGDAPDIIINSPLQMPDFMQAGQFEDIASKVDFSNFSEAAKDSVSKDGKIYGVPMSIAARVVFYNKDLFQEAGITDVPKSKTDFEKACEALKAKGILPILSGFKDVGFFSTVTFMGDFFGGPMQKSPTFFTDVSARTKKFSDFPEFKAALERWDKYLRDYSNKDAFSIDYATELSKFANGDGAMIFQGPWAPATILKNNPNGNFGSFPIFAYDNAADNAIMESADDCLVMSSQSKSKDEAAKFMSYCISPAAADIWVKETGNISPVKGAEPSTNPMIKDMSAFMSNGEIKAIFYESMAVPSGKFNDTFNTTLEEFAADNNRTADKYIKKLDDQFDKLAGK